MLSEITPPGKPLEKINPLENTQNEKYILYYCSSLAVVLGIGNKKFRKIFLCHSISI